MEIELELAGNYATKFGPTVLYLNYRKRVEKLWTTTPVFLNTSKGSHYKKNVPYTYGYTADGTKYTDVFKKSGFTIPETLNFDFTISEEQLPRYIKWDYRHLELATWYGNRLSKDPSTKVGAVIVDPKKNKPISLGFNGFPRGTSDDAKLYLNREEKYKRVVHGEMNAIHDAMIPIEGFSLYTSSLSPCIRCATSIIQTGISKVVFYSHPVPERWAKEMEEAINLMREAKIEVYSLPCITLIKQEFSET